MLCFFLPADILKQNKQKLNKFSEEVWDKFSVDFSSSFTLEYLTSTQAYQNDFLLNLVQAARPVYDPNSVFTKRQSELSFLPEEIKKQKIIFTGFEIIKIFARMSRSLEKEDRISEVDLGLKILKLNMILISLMLNKFFDAHNLYNGLASEPAAQEYLPFINTCLGSLGNKIFTDNLGILTAKIQKDLVLAKLLPENFYKSHKQSDAQLDYGISSEWK